MLVTRVSPNQSNAAPLIGARAKNLQAASARHRSPGAARRRRQRQAHIPLPTSTSSPTRSTPGLSAQFLRTHHRRVRRGSSSYAAGFSGIRCTSLASAATYAFVAAAAGQRDDGARCRSDRRFDGFDISCSVADAAAAPSFASARRREAALPAQTVTAALCNLRSVSQWVRRVYIPHPRRETDRSLSSPATAVCIPHLCESRPHAARCACEVHGMKCGWRARV